MPNSNLTSYFTHIPSFFDLHTPRRFDLDGGTVAALLRLDLDLTKCRRVLAVHPIQIAKQRIDRERVAREPSDSEHVFGNK